jgi:hypothetical protein
MASGGEVGSAEIISEVIQTCDLVIQTCDLLPRPCLLLHLFLRDVTARGIGHVSAYLVGISFEQVVWCRRFETMPPAPSCMPAPIG